MALNELAIVSSRIAGIHMFAALFSIVSLAIWRMVSFAMGP